MPLLLVKLGSQAFELLCILGDLVRFPSDSLSLAFLVVEALPVLLLEALDIPSGCQPIV